MVWLQKDEVNEQFSTLYNEKILICLCHLVLVKCQLEAVMVFAQ